MAERVARETRTVRPAVVGVTGVEGDLPLIGVYVFPVQVSTQAGRARGGPAPGPRHDGDGAAHRGVSAKTRGPAGREEPRRGFNSAGGLRYCV